MQPTVVVSEVLIDFFENIGAAKTSAVFTSYKVTYLYILCFFKSYLSVSKFVFSTLAQAEGFLLPLKVIVILYIQPGFRVFFSRVRRESSVSARS